MLPVTRLTLHIEQEQDLRLPDHAGSMLRGSFGSALKKLACITRQKECPSCPLYRSCAYPAIFETPAPASSNPLARQTVNPYVIQPPPMGSLLVPKGELWEFGFHVAGRMIDQLPLMAYAWQRACENGFGANRSRARLMAITQQGMVIYRPDAPFEARRLPLPEREYGAQTRLRFLTPLRLQHEGHVLLRAEQITAPLLLMALARRIQKLSDIHTHDRPQLNLAALRDQAGQLGLVTDGLRHVSISRYSSRQQQTVELDGMLGDVILQGHPGDFGPLITFGEAMHVGKNATHGLGRFVIEPV